MCDRIGIIQKGKLVGVETVHDFVEEGGQAVRVLVDDPPLAAKVLKEKLALAVTLTDDEALNLSIEREKIPVVVDTLVLSKLKIYGVSAMQKSLEDRFLEVTGGKSVE